MAMEEEPPSEIKLVTLNCWGLKHGLSKLRAERLAEIGRQLASLDPPPHVVALQECWSEQEDYQVIRRETRAVLPYGKFYYSGAFGAGLVILSQWPMEESSMVQFPLSGRPTAFIRRDWYVGKGVACASIRLGPGPRHVLHVFNTHFHAGYRGIWDAWDTYACHKLSQAWELAKLVRAAVERGHLAVAMGDFNIAPDSPAYRLLTAHAPVRDTWRLIHPNSSLGPPAQLHQLHRPHQPPSSPSFNISEHGVTSNSILNTWTWSKTQRKELISPEKVPTLVPPNSADNRAQRIDYVFAGYSPPESPNHDAVWMLRNAEVGMTKRHPRLDVSLSDHFSVEVTLVLVNPDQAPRPPLVTALNPLKSGDSLTVDDSAVHSGAFLQTGSPAVSEFRVDIAKRHSLAVEATDQQLEFPASMYDEVLAMIHQYTQREIKQRHWRTVHFWVSLAVTAACLVTVCFSPHNYVAFILALVAALSLTAGVIDGLLALLFFGQELRALGEFEWEIMNAKASAAGARSPSSPSQTPKTALQSI